MSTTHPARVLYTLKESTTALKQSGLLIGNISADYIKASLSKASTIKQAIEPGYHTIARFLHYCSLDSVFPQEDTICQHIASGSMEATVDMYGRFIIPERELVRYLKEFGDKK